MVTLESTLSTVFIVLYCLFSALRTFNISSPHFVSMLFSVPDTPRPVRRQHWPRFDTFDPILTNFKPLRQIPQEKVDEHTAGAQRCTAVRAQSGSNTFDGDDRCGAYSDLLACTGREFFVRVEGGDERGGVGEYSEVVEDLGNAVVCEHRELADAVWEERVWNGVGGRGKGCPGLGYHDLGTFPEEDCSIGCAISTNVGVYACG